MSEYARRFRLLPLAALLCVGSCLSTEGYYRYQDGGPSGRGAATERPGSGGAPGSAGTTGGGRDHRERRHRGQRWQTAGAAGNTATGTAGRGGTTGTAGRRRGGAGRRAAAGRGGTTGAAGVDGRRPARRACCSPIISNPVSSPMELCRRRHRHR